MAIGVSSLVIVSCIIISFTGLFKHYNDRLSLALAGDLIITAPLLYYLFIRNTGISKMTVLRVCMAGILIAAALLNKSQAPVISIIKHWLSPILEAVFIGYIIGKFYTANRSLKAANQPVTDFLLYSRALLQSVTGSGKFANVLSSELAVFYYIFRGKDRAVDNKTIFSSYKTSGAVLVLSTFLYLFVVETAGMHFVFLLWGKMVAWVLTGLSLYTCMQLFAHIRALRARSILVQPSFLLLRNGILGGDVMVQMDNIMEIKCNNKSVDEIGAVKLAFIKGLENHNTVIYLNKPVTVIKAFGVKKKAGILLLNIDDREKFITVVEQFKNKPVI